MKMGDRIRQMRTDAGMTQEELAEKLGLQKSAIAKYENGRVENIKRSTIQKMAELFDRTPSYVMGFTDTSGYNSDNITAPVARVPVLGYVAAGIPIEEIEDIVDYEEIPAELLRGGKKYFGLVLRGDSMEPRMYDGDVVIVQKQDDAESGEYVIAAVNGDHATCKRLMKYRDSIALVSLNSKYDPMIFTNEKVQEKPVTILGVVREIRGKMKGM